MVNAASSTEHTNIINYTRGVDVSDENQKTGETATPGNTDTRPSIHGDVAHSRPLPVNYGGSTGVMLYYGANDGVFRAVRGSDGKEMWGFIAPEHFTGLKRLYANSPLIDYGYSPPPSPAPTKKDYFFDGTAGVYQTFNSDNTANTVWIFPTMRRGGRMVYGFDVSTPASPTLKWRVGCTNPSLADTASCTTSSAEFQRMGQTWSIPAVAKVKGFTNGGSTEAGKDVPLIIMGGGYDTCEDTDSSSSTCSSPKGNRVFVLNADTGALVRSFTTSRSVAADVTLVDRDFDQRADHAYVADTGGSIYRIDFINPSTLASRDESAWTITKIAYTSGGGRKFLFPPAALVAGPKTFLSITSGDRERPLITNYPYVDDVRNRAYMLIDTYLTSGLPIDLDDPDNLRVVTNDNSCSTVAPTGGSGSGNLGWRFTFGGDFLGTRGEQGVTSSIIFGGLIFFSTNRPLPAGGGTCENNLGEAKGYAVNLLNGSGAVGVPGLCGGTRSAIFTGGGLPPSPVTGTVPVGGKPVTVMIGGINREGGASSPIGAQKVKPTITQIRSRIYWYRQGDK
jgi:Tfp pilus tip-associated adhesin PilY1